MDMINKSKLCRLGGGISRVFLRPILESDTNRIIEWRNQEYIKNCFIDRADFTYSSHLEWLHKKVDTGKAIQYIIEYRNPVGTIYIRDINLAHENGELGIFIGEKEALGNGLGSEAIDLFLPFVFSLGFHKIFLRVISDNIQAIKCYLNCGFSIDGIAREMIYADGIWRDVFFMSVLNKNMPGCLSSTLFE